MTDTFIRTVEGDINPEDLGYCQCHEHLFIAKGKSGEMVPSLILDDYLKSTEELDMYYAGGGRSIVDAQPVGCGRMAVELTEASKQSNVHIVASTGFHKLDFYDADHFVFTGGQDEMKQLFIDELTSGMYTDRVNGPEVPSARGPAKAGIIKAASDGRDIRLDEGNLSVYRKLFSAAGAAARKTGAPIMTHLEMGTGAESQLEVLTAQGISPHRIVMSHLDRVLDAPCYESQLEAAKSGVYLQLDTIGRFKYHSDEEEALFIAMLCEKGYENKILLGFDTTNERMKYYGGVIGLDYIMNNFRHLLRKYGVGDELFRTFTVDNPRKALCFEYK